MSQALLNTALAVVCVACYTLLVLLYIKPEIYHIDSLTNPDHNTLRPAVAVSLLAVILNAATVTLVTRCVESSLWIKLAKEPTNENFDETLTVGEARRLAQWSTSTLTRLTYLFGSFAGSDRRSWLLRIAGPLLVATASVGPVLLSGVSTSSLKTTSTESVSRTEDPWRSRLDSGNERYRGGNSFDNPTFIAALAAMRNLSAPVAPLCDDTDARSTCSVSGQAVAIQAKCIGRTQDNPDLEGTIDIEVRNSTYCIGQDTATEICLDLQAGSPATYSMFASGLPACDSQNITECPAAGIDGQWAKIFGVWVNGVDITGGSKHPLNFVNCDVTYGNITVKQNGTSPPTLDRDSYVQANSTDGYQFGYTTFNIIQLNRIYTELGNSPYDWKLAAVTTGSNTIYSTPVAMALLGLDANNDAETVARQIEANFDMATLHSFARGSNSSDLVFTRTKLHPIYVYKSEVLFILLVPFLATVFGTWMRWQVADQSINIGYDPVGVARLGPVAGLTHGTPGTKGQRKYEESFKVWRWTRTTVDQQQRAVVATGVQAFDPRTSHHPQEIIVNPK